MQCDHDGFGLFLTRCTSYFGRAAPDARFDFIKRANPIKHMRRDGRGLLGMDIVETTPRMGPASGLDDSARCVDLIRSEERRVGHECVSTCRSRCWAYN